MHRLLIVDDEPIIVEGLYDMFQNVKYLDLDIYKAYSGEEALQLLERARIDIVLTDISMPGIDGLRLLEEIRRHWPLCRVILLTAYNDFNYIYTALKNECVSYLLKNEDDSTVIGAVEKAVKDLDIYLKEKMLLDEVKSKSQITNFIMQKECMAALLQEPVFVPAIWKEQFEELNIPLRFDYPFLLVVGKLDEKPKHLNNIEFQKSIYNVWNFAQSNLSYRLFTACMEFERLNIAWFLQPKELPVDGPLCTISSEDWKQITMFTMYTFETLQEYVRRYLDTSMSFVISNGPVDWENAPAKFELLKTLLDKELGTKNGAIMIESNLQKSVRIISFLKQYITEHLKEDISLITLSEIVHFNPSYLSRIFKQVTGVSLSDYILTERINRARKLLTGSRMKIYEIAGEVGFESVTYFTRVFKNTMKMTPQKYRDITACEMK